MLRENEGKDRAFRICLKSDVPIFYIKWRTLSFRDYSRKLVFSCYLWAMTRGAQVISPVARTRNTPAKPISTDPALLI